ncbi:hypothetical protein Tco_0348198 [Tanacetum coccineum]
MRQLMCLEESSDEFAATKAKPQRANKNDTQWFQKEKVIKENSDSIASLRSESTSLKVKGSSDAKKQVQKAHKRAHKLENQVCIVTPPNLGCSRM